MINQIRLILGAVLLVLGFVIYLIEIFGIFKLKYVMNRMHAAAMGDTLALSCSLLVLMIISGWNNTTLKLMLVIIFFWFASPVSSHLIARLEITTNENPREQMQIYDSLEALEQDVEAERVQNRIQEEEQEQEERS